MNRQCSGKQRDQFARTISNHQLLRIQMVSRCQRVPKPHTVRIRIMGGQRQRRDDGADGPR
ncbi:MAG: hypothetical protein C4293_12410 [Nitrospiraceae bacterium]